MKWFESLKKAMSDEQKADAAEAKHSKYDPMVAVLEAKPEPTAEEAVSLQEDNNKDELFLATVSEYPWPEEYTQEPESEENVGVLTNHPDAYMITADTPTTFKLEEYVKAHPEMFTPLKANEPENEPDAFDAREHEALTRYLEDEEYLVKGASGPAITTTTLVEDIAASLKESRDTTEPPTVGDLVSITGKAITINNLTIHIDSEKIRMRVEANGDVHIYPTLLNKPTPKKKVRKR